MKCCIAIVILLISCLSVASATTPEKWTMWVEGDPVNWEELSSWVLNGGDSKLPTGNLVLRLIDPLGANGGVYAIEDTPSGDLHPALDFIKNLRQTFDGQISVLPYYNHNTQGWKWPNNNATSGLDQWLRPMQWAIQANQALATHGVARGIDAVNYENFGSHSFVEVDDAHLLAWQNYLLENNWPQWDQSPGFVGIIVSKDNKSATNMLRWTTTKKGPWPDYADNYYQYPPLVGGMLECYEIYKDNCSDYAGGQHTVVDVSNESHQPPYYPPFSPGPQIYEAAGNSSDPASTLLGTPTQVCPNPTLSPPEPSTLGFLVAVNAPPCDSSLSLPNCMTGADMSKITFLFSDDKNLSGKVFGTWDGVTTPATVDTFKEFVGQFDDAFQTYWNPLTMPQYGLWDFGLLPSSWHGNAPSCPADLTGNSVVDVEDLLGVVDFFGTEAGDLNGDGVTDIEDLLHVLDRYGALCH